MHHGSTVLLRAMLPKYRRHFALLLSAVNIASKDVIEASDIKLVKELLYQYVKEWEKIFGLRYMSSNVHSLLHMHESIEFLGPLYIYSTFNFEGQFIIYLRIPLFSMYYTNKNCYSFNNFFIGRLKKSSLIYIYFY
jgi:hypothetical protein